MVIQDVNVPDIGDFSEVVVIEILVAKGDKVKAEQSLITVESDKASMEIPSPGEGVIEEILIKIGDKVSEGSLIMRMQQQAASEASLPAATSALVHAQSAVDCDLLVLGAGPGGYSAAFRAADLGMKVILVERYATLGGVCLNVGCIPSKALLHIAAVSEEAVRLEKHGIRFAKPSFDLPVLRHWKQSVISKLTGGLASMAKQRKVEHLQAVARFTGTHSVALTESDGTQRSLRFSQAIIAAGSEAIRLPFLPDDPRIVDSTGALELPLIPERLLIIGGGIIGLEMATVYSSLGARLDVVEMLDGLMPGADRDLVKVWQQFNQHRFDHIMLKTKTVSATAHADGITVDFEQADGQLIEKQYDLVLCSVGRRPNGHKLGLDAAGVHVDDKGFIPVDSQMRTNQANIFAIGDIVGQPMLAHKAVHEGHVAAEAAHGSKDCFDARVIPSVAYTDPEIAWVGLTEADASRMGVKLNKSVFPWAASGRAIANGRDEGFTKLLFDAEHGRLVGGAIVGTQAGDMIGEIALAIEMGADASDIGRTIHPHPTLGESIGMAAEAALGICTDLPPRKRA
ncbi:MAG: dihydrolipoyl dehydrogenase [Betaproteobacteria bacterium]|nr:dihydrolipoyl dehydrogenase [Betaproteobacteria bacterium]